MKRMVHLQRFILLGMLFIVLLTGMRNIRSFFFSKSENAQETIRLALVNASTQCYALEGSYPPNLEYLEEHYGIALNREKYEYFFNVFASNVMPDIIVISKEVE